MSHILISFYGLTLVMIRIALYYSCLALSLCTFGNVWEVKDNWSPRHENQYSLWIKSQSVHQNIFSNKDSAYYGIMVDCADLAFALRAIYSFKNQLPFWGIETNKFDHIKSQREKVISFINYFSTNKINSVLLSNELTYSIKISDVKPGDIFSYSFKSSGKTVKHVYVIKNVNEFGLFDILFSNPQRRGKKLAYYKNFSLRYRPLKKNWGFKRFIGSNKKNNESQEQYQKAANLSEREFWKWTRVQLASQEESGTQTVRRHLETLCSLAKDRIKNVKESIKYKNKINRCMNYDEFDLYSTVSRDQNLFDAFESFYDDWTTVKIESPELVREEDDELANLILDSNEWNDNDIETLEKHCKLNKSLHLGLIYKNLYLKRTSSNPNLSSDSRWGLSLNKTSDCPHW